MSEEDFIVGYTLFKPGGFKTRYQHFDKLEVAKMFASNVNLKDNSKIYVPLELYEKQQKEIEDLKEIDRQICNEELITQEYVQNNYIKKDKIREKIKDLKNNLKSKEEQNEYFETLAKIEILEELLGW